MTEHPPNSRGRGRQSTAAVVCTLALLCGVAVDRFVLAGPTAKAEAYHEQVRGAAGVFPIHFDRWLGIDAEVPTAAVTMLKPNVIISRNYQELGRNRHVTVLLVQCRDSRDILGHYPPVCYKNQGWAMQSAEPRNWTVDEQAIEGMRYVFTLSRNGSNQELTIDNFMILPTGETAGDMDDVDRAARDSRLKHFGAAQVQLVYGPGVTEADRAEIFETFARQLQPVLSAVMKPGREVTR